MFACTAYEFIRASILPFFPLFHRHGCFRSLGPASSYTSSFFARWNYRLEDVWNHKRSSDINAYDAIGKILDDRNVDTEVNYVYFNHLSLLNEQIYLIDSIYISQLTKLELWLDKAKAGIQ